MIQKNTVVTETVLKVIGSKPGYVFHLLNECNAPVAVRDFKKPGMACIALYGIKFANEVPRIAFVNDLDEPEEQPFYW